MVGSRAGVPPEGSHRTPADPPVIPSPAPVDPMAFPSDPLDSQATHGTDAPPVHTQPGSALDSKAVTDPFPQVVGNAPEGAFLRNGVPDAIPGEVEVDHSTRFPTNLSTGWIRKQVAVTDWERHWKAGGRITPALILEIHTGLSHGYSIASLCRRLAVTDSAWYEWKQRALQGSEPHGILTRVVNHALGKSEDYAVDAWVSKVPEDWRAAEAFLKARFPEQYATGSRVSVQHEGNVTHDVVVHQPYTNDDLLAIASILQQQGALGGGDVIDVDVVDDDR